MNLGRYLPKARRDFSAALDYRRELDAQDESRVAELQLRKLQEVWQDAVSDVPYYGSLVREGRAPAEIRNWDDFREIPELTRQILQDRAPEFARISGAPDMRRLTGGSTGTPVRLGVWHSEDEVIRMLKLVLWSRVGYEPGDRLFLIWGHSHLLGTGWRRYWNHFVRKAKDTFVGYKRVDAYRMDRKRAEDYLRQMENFAASGLIGYSTILDLMVRLLPDERERARALRLKFVMPSAEAAPRPNTFALLSDAFGCPTIQEFGGIDFGQVAMKLGDEPFEVFAEYNVLETADQETMELPEMGDRRSEGSVKGGEWRVARGQSMERSPEIRGQKTEDRERRAEGEAALVTALYRRYLPLIRYRQGDLLGGCRKLEHGHVAVFDRLEGRLNDMVVLPDGTSVHCSAVLHCVRTEPSVLGLQMVLEDEGLRILLVEGGGYDAAAEDRIRQRLSQVSSSLANATIERVDDVRTSRAGKRRWFVDERTHSQEPRE